MPPPSKYSLIFFLLTTVGAVRADTLPRDILTQLPSGYDVLTYVSGDLNRDRLPDYLIALHKKSEARFGERQGRAPRRPLMIFVQNSDGRFRLAKRNDHVIYAINEGGQCDPFLDGSEGMVIKGLYFTVQNGVACGAHWTDFITFRYVPKSDNWIFHNRIIESWRLNDGSDPDADALVLQNRSIEKGSGKTPIAFESYRPR